MPFNPLRVLSGLLGALAVIAALAAFPAGLYLLSQLDRTLHAQSYRPATFTVAWVAYRPSGHKTSAEYWAVGTLDGGHRERYYLTDVVGGVTGWDDLEAQVAPGREFKVLYDPSYARGGEDGHHRVIAFEDDFVSRQRSRLVRTVALAYGTPIALLLAATGIGFLAGTYPRIATSLSLFFLTGGIIGLLVIGVVQSMIRAEGTADAGPGRVDHLAHFFSAVPWGMLLFLCALGTGILRTILWVQKRDPRY
jgi:hypothetical protein